MSHANGIAILKATSVAASSNNSSETIGSRIADNSNKVNKVKAINNVVSSNKTKATRSKTAKAINSKAISKETNNKAINNKAINRKEEAEAEVAAAEAVTCNRRRDKVVVLSNEVVAAASKAAVDVAAVSSPILKHIVNVTYCTYQKIHLL